MECTFHGKIYISCSMNSWLILNLESWYQTFLQSQSLLLLLHTTNAASRGNTTGVLVWTMSGVKTSMTNGFDSDCFFTTALTPSCHTTTGWKYGGLIRIPSWSPVTILKLHINLVVQHLWPSSICNLTTHSKGSHWLLRVIPDPRTMALLTHTQWFNTGLILPFLTPCNINSCEEPKISNLKLIGQSSIGISCLGLRPSLMKA